MAKQYYYFVTGLSNIGFDDTKQALSPQAFFEEAALKLNASDIKLLKLLYLPQDLDNLLRILFHKDQDQFTNSMISAEDWQALIDFIKPNPDNEMRIKPPIYKQIPAFVVEHSTAFLATETEQVYLEWETRFLKSFYEYTSSHSNRFIREWFSFNRDIKNILSALNGRKFDYSYAEFLLGDGELIEKLAKSQASDFGLGKQYPLFESVYRIYDQYGIVDRERNYDALRWRWIDNQNFFQYFNIDRILGYFCKLCIIDRWMNLELENGKELFFDTLNKLENSFSFPEEFDLKQKVKQ